MATVDEEIARLQFISRQGRGQEKCHVVLIEVEAKERMANPKLKTRFVLETDDPILYSDFNRYKDRWFGVANKSVALSVMAKLWDRPVQWIQEVCSGDQTRQGSDTGGTL